MDTHDLPNVHGPFGRSMGVCSDSIARPMLTGRCHLSIPCVGDRLFEATSDNEVIFAVPSTRLEDITNGLKYIYQHKPSSLRVTRYLDFEPVRKMKKEGYNIVAFAQDLGINEKPD